MYSSTVPPSAAATTFQFGPFLAPGKPKGDSAEGEKRTFIPALSNKLPLVLPKPVFAWQWQLSHWALPQAFKPQRFSQQQRVRRSAAGTATAAHRQPSASERAASPPAPLLAPRSCEAWLGLTTMLRNTVCVTLSRPRPLCGLTLLGASPACTGVPGASSGFSTASRGGSFSAWQWARACLCQETLWVTDG